MAFKQIPNSIRVGGKVYVRPNSVWNGMIKDLKYADYAVKLKHGTVYARPKWKGSKFYKQWSYSQGKTILRLR